MTPIWVLFNPSKSNFNKKFIRKYLIINESITLQQLKIEILESLDLIPIIVDTTQISEHFQQKLNRYSIYLESSENKRILVADNESLLKSLSDSWFGQTFEIEEDQTDFVMTEEPLAEIRQKCAEKMNQLD